LRASGPSSALVVFGALRSRGPMATNVDSQPFSPYSHNGCPLRFHTSQRHMAEFSSPRVTATGAFAIDTTCTLRYAPANELRVFASATPGVLRKPCERSYDQVERINGDAICAVNGGRNGGRWCRNNLSELGAERNQTRQRASRIHDGTASRIGVPSGIRTRVLGLKVRSLILAPNDNERSEAIRMSHQSGFAAHTV